VWKLIYAWHVVLVGIAGCEAFAVRRGLLEAFVFSADFGAVRQADPQGRVCNGIDRRSAYVPPAVFPREISVVDGQAAGHG
jgi:hypothetical protein